MLDIKLTGEFILKKRDMLIRNYIKELSVDCIMKIVVDNRIIYDDWVCPLELYFQLLIWNNNIKKQPISFYYVSDDNGVNPIFSIEFCDDNKWKFKNNLTNIECYLSIKDIKEFFIKYKYQMQLHEDS